MIVAFFFEKLCEYFEELCEIAIPQSCTKKHRKTQRKTSITVINNFGSIDQPCPGFNRYKTQTNTILFSAELSLVRH